MQLPIIFQTLIADYKPEPEAVTEHTFFIAFFSAEKLFSLPKEMQRNDLIVLPENPDQPKTDAT